MHPLPEADGKRHLYPWAWRVDDDGPVAFEVGPTEPGEVWVDHHGLVASATGEPPADVALAVILASKGLDSAEAMAEAMDTEAGNHRESRERYGYHPHPTDATLVEDLYAHAAAMLRRGTVDPS